MATKRPELIIILSGYLFFLALIFGLFAVASLAMIPSISGASAITLVVFVALFGATLAGGIGLLHRKAWGKNYAIAIYGLVLFDGLVRISEISSGFGGSMSYEVGRLLGALLNTGMGSLSLYALLKNSAVRRYFAKAEAAD